MQEAGFTTETQRTQSREKTGEKTGINSSLCFLSFSVLSVSLW